MKLIITIQLDNAAFADDRIDEIERILQDLVERLPEEGGTNGAYVLRDVNGNSVGWAAIK